LLTKAAEDGNADAQLALAWIFVEGRLAPKNLDRAVQYADQASRGGLHDKRLEFSIADEYRKAEAGFAKFGRWLKQAAEHGLPQAQLQWGILRSAEFPGEALAWYRLAAIGGLGEAATRLGEAYASGDGIAVDKNLALHWYQVAADSGDADAGYLIWAELRSENLLSLAQSLQWLRRSAAMGNEEAAAELAECYELGVGVEKNIGKAIEWSEKAARAGSPAGALQLGRLLLRDEASSRRDEGYMWLVIAQLRALDFTGEIRSDIRKLIPDTKYPAAKKAAMITIDSLPKKQRKHFKAYNVSDN